VAWVVLLISVLALDVCFVALPGAATPGYCSSYRTLIAGYHANISGPQAMAIFDGLRVRWLWKDIEPTPKFWPADWDHFGDVIAIPRTQASGLLLPFRVEWHHQTNVFVSEEHGGKTTERRLLRELADKLRSDPAIGPRMPTWYWEKLATEPGVTVSYNFLLLGHDILVVAALCVIAWQFVVLASACKQLWGGPGPGFCVKCGYDLRALRPTVVLSVER
jgi:hypothetical protein